MGSPRARVVEFVEPRPWVSLNGSNAATSPPSRPPLRRTAYQAMRQTPPPPMLPARPAPQPREPVPEPCGGAPDMTSAARMR